jgi:hypothetical protein
VRVCKADGVIGQDFAVADAESLDPALLAERQRNEKAQLDKLRNRKVPM